MTYLIVVVLCHIIQSHSVVYNTPNLLIPKPQILSSKPRERSRDLGKKTKSVPRDKGAPQPDMTSVVEPIVGHVKSEPPSPI